MVCLVFQLGFKFHHAQENYVMLKKWLPEQEEDNTPAYAAQYLGCGGLVVNEHNQMLVVKEKYHTTPTWKLPGGHAEPGKDNNYTLFIIYDYTGCFVAGEEIAEATQREVFEETGVRCQFESVLLFRHQHDYKYGCSDFYFVSVCRPLTHAINAGFNEIALCTWMDVSFAPFHF